MTALIVALVTAGALGLIGWRWWDERRDQAARVAYVTVQGVAVLHPPKGSTAPSRDVVEMAIETAREAWPGSDVDEYLHTVRLGWSAGLTVMAGGKPSNMAGASDIGWSEVALGDPPRVFPLLVHEFGHQCLFGRGVPRNRHHETFEAAGFSY